MAGLARGEPALGLNPASADFWRVVADSPALRARTREISENTEAALAAALADRWGLGDEDPLPRLLAGAINGTYRATVAEILQQILAGKDVETVRHSVSTAADQAFALLESSLADHERATRN